MCRCRCVCVGVYVPMCALCGACGMCYCVPIVWLDFTIVHTCRCSYCVYVFPLALSLSLILPPPQVLIPGCPVCSCLLWRPSLLQLPPPAPTAALQPPVQTLPVGRAAHGPQGAVPPPSAGGAVSIAMV